MPLKTGLEALTEIRNYYKATNSYLEISRAHDTLTVEEPLFVFLTAFNTP
jgi:hypothetical protein